MLERVERLNVSTAWMWAGVACHVARQLLEYLAHSYVAIVVDSKDQAPGCEESLDSIEPRQEGAPSSGTRETLARSQCDCTLLIVMKVT
jgi:hypothetical protein